MKLDKAVLFLEQKLQDLKTAQYKDADEWIESIEHALYVIRREQSYEDSLEDMFLEHLKETEFKVA